MDAKLYAPAAERNREPILEVLRQVLPPLGTVLEVGSTLAAPRQLRVAGRVS